MTKRKRRHILPEYNDRILNLAVIALVIFGSLMIFSAEMGNALLPRNVDNPSYITGVMVKQLIFVIIGLLSMLFMAWFPVFKLSKELLKVLAFILLGVLMSIRFIWGDIYGAYAWMRIGPITIQPSEFAKLFIIIYFAKVLSTLPKDKTKIKDEFKKLMLIGLAFGIIIVFWQKDLGSGFILMVIGYMMLLIPSNRAYTKIQMWMFGIMIVVIVIVMLLLSPAGTNFLEGLGSDNYQINRFLASSNPFKDQYNIGYHLVISLVSFATGGIFGLGYGNSVHKYMNFPNPENDFILPVIVEELGVIGFSFILILYGLIWYRLLKYALDKRTDLRAKLVLLGVALYFMTHFILNVGGVSEILPLTGVPLLLISAGGSSWISILMAVGLAQNEINRINKKNMEEA